MILDFFNLVANLKKIPRQGWIEKAEIKNPESVADHTYSMTVITMILSDLNELNSEKIMKMSLLHDLAESITGDITPENMNKNDKNILENDAMKKILKNLPSKLMENYEKLWNEYQEQITAEAQFVHEVDKLEMALQAKIYAKTNLSKETLDMFLNSAKNNINNPHVKKILTMISEQ